MTLKVRRRTKGYPTRVNNMAMSSPVNNDIEGKTQNKGLPYTCEQDGYE